MKGTPWQKRFWAKVNKDGPVSPHPGTPGTPCWIWTGALDRKGYGHIDVLGLPWRVHRLSFVIAGRAIPDGLCVLHKCDTRLCVRPDHLYAGTDLQNVQDRVSRKRSSSYVFEPPQAKLTPDLVRHIRARAAADSSLTVVELAGEYGLGLSTIWRVVTRRSWKHVSGEATHRRGE